MRKTLLTLLLTSAVIPTCCGETITVNVDPKMDLSNAGQPVLNVPYPYPIQYSYTLLPVGVNLPTGSSSIEFTSVTGIASAGPYPLDPYPGWPWNGPGGGTNPPGLVANILSWNGISGVLADT